MVAIVSTVAYLGLEARGVEVQVQLSTGIPRFVIVGLPDKAVAESRERVRAALTAIGLALPPKVITVNMSPADLPRKAAISTCRSPLACWPPWGRSMPRC
jgi:magnesium chelatase family protein